MSLSVTIADPRPTAPELVEHDDNEQFLLGRQLQDKLLDVADMNLRKTLEAILAYLQRPATGSVPARFRFFGKRGSWRFRPW